MPRLLNRVLNPDGKTHTRQDVVYLVVTVNKRANAYALRVTKPTSLAQNQYAYAVRIDTDERDWMDRIIEVHPPKVTPPEVGSWSSSAIVEKDTPTKVLERLAKK